MIIIIIGMYYLSITWTIIKIRSFAMILNKRWLYTEMTQAQFEITNIHMDTDPMSKMVSYPTSRSAFILTLSGSGRVHFDNLSFPASPHKLIHGCPGKVLTFEPYENFKHLSVYYKLNQPSDALVSYLDRPFSLSISNQSEIEEQLEMIVELYQTTGLNAVVKQKLMSQTLLHAFFGSENYNDETDKIESYIEFMEENIEKPLSLNDIAEHFNLSASQFSYLFHKHTQMRPIDYLINLRLEHAIDLLKLGYSVKETSISVGYTDPLYFSRLFKKRFGIAPSHFKQKAQ